MGTSRSFDWGLIVFAALAVLFVFIIVRALRRMRQRDFGEDEQLRADAQRREREKRRTARAEEDRGAGEEEGEGAQPARVAPVKPTPQRKPDSRAAAPVIDRAEEQRRLTAGLAKTRGGFVSRLGGLFRGKQIDEALVEQIEEVLFTADIGSRSAQELIDSLRKALSKKELSDPEAIWRHLKAHAVEMLGAQGTTPSASTLGQLGVDGRQQPFVLLVIGVNGTGKTTTVGKLAARLRQNGRSVLLAAGDTFRAAAVEQLQVWGDRAQVPVVRGPEGADPASVIVDALKRAKHEAVDIVIADTAGRLHTKVSLMEELQKVRRAIARQVDGAPHETWLVLDATMGQNAISQAQMFKEAMALTGIVLTKLDGTAKGGVVLGISNELRLPIRLIGVGEGIDDLREFDPQAFVEALYDRAPAGAAD